MESYSPLELNAYLDRLTEGWDGEAARSIVAAFLSLTPVRDETVYHKSEKTEGAAFKGFTQEAGNISVRDSQIKHTTIGEKTEEYRRIGLYKVKKYGREDGDIAMLYFKHFWKADPSTRGLESPNPAFGIEYLTETLEPYALIFFEYVEGEPPFLQKIGILLLSIQAHLSAALRGRKVKMISRFYRTYGRVIYGSSRMGYGDTFDTTAE